MSKIKKEKPSEADKREFLDFFIELLDFKNKDDDICFTKGQARVLLKIGLQVPGEIKFGYNFKHHHTLSLHVDDEEGEE